MPCPTLKIFIPGILALMLGIASINHGFYRPSSEIADLFFWYGLIVVFLGVWLTCTSIVMSLQPKEPHGKPNTR